MAQPDKLEKSNVENIMGLTSMQQGMLFHYMKDQESSEYHGQVCISLTGPVRFELLQRAWEHVVNSNEMLRTVFRWENIDKPVQVTLKNKNIRVKFTDMSDVQDQSGVLEAHLRDERSQRLDLANETFRVNLYKLNDTKYEMTVLNHHIIYDGWSNGIILNELMQYYTSLCSDINFEISKKTSFSEFLSYVNKLDLEEHKRYWKSRLGDFDDYEDYFSKSHTGRTKVANYEIDTKKYGILTEWARTNKLALSSVIYSAWGVLLQKLNSNNTAIFGTVVSGRPPMINKVDSIVGLFINTVPLKVTTTQNLKLIDLIRNVDEELKGRQEYVNTPLVDILKLTEQSDINKLFNSIVVIENYPLNKTLPKNCPISITNYTVHEKSNYNMTVDVFLESEIRFKFTFNEGVLHPEVEKHLGVYLEKIIDAILLAPNTNVEDVELLNDVDIKQLIHKFNNTIAEYPMDMTIQQLFENQVSQSPESIAVIYGEERLSYSELNIKVNSLAKLLRSNGVTRDSIVAIMTQRSVEMIVGIYAILKAGGAYLPIDPNHPKERVQYILNDSESKIILSNDSLIENINFDGQYINLLDESNYREDGSDIECINTPQDLAYVIYTSGTTGNPKGVMIEHNALINRLNWMQKAYPLTTQDIILQKTTYAFDVSVWEIIWWSLYGAKVCLLESEAEKDPLKIMETIKEHNVTVMHFVPSMLEAFLGYAESVIANEFLCSLKRVFCSGEALRAKTVSKFYNLTGEKIDLVNLYGPTEATIDVTYFNCANNDSEIIPIGKPIDNIQLYILNNSKLAPIGVKGELHIGGDGLARGYINNPILTKEKFIDNPFALDEKIYKTGDYARWLPDGNIEYLGRLDSQIKLRGFRIELGEIESKLLELKDVNEVAVLLDGNTETEKTLRAYFTSSEHITAEMVKEHLRDNLPAYMIPDNITQLKNMPLTPNGKLDRRKLPRSISKVYQETDNLPDNMSVKEKLVCTMMEEVLSVSGIEVNDNFFEMGGHSLKAISLVSKIRKELKVEVPISEIFKNPTVRDITRYIETIEENQTDSIKKIDSKKHYVTSSSQNRMFLLQQMDLSSTSYNMYVAMDVKGKLDRNKVEESVKILINRHESLRTSFDIVDESISQKIHDEIDFKLAYDKQSVDIETEMEAFIKPFDLSVAPLFRMKLIDREDDGQFLMFDAHHIIFDGVSANIFLQELSAVYDGQNLGKLEYQYKDFADWQNRYFNTRLVNKQESYWLDKYSKHIPKLNLPTDYPRPDHKLVEGDQVTCNIDNRMYDELKKIARQNSCTLNMVLLSGISILLSKYSGDEEIVIGSPIAGRQRIELERIIGVFINTLAIKNHVDGNLTYVEYLSHVRENSIQAYTNQDYPFDQLVEKLNIKRDNSRNPLFDVMFAVQNVEADNLTMGNAKIDLIDRKSKTSKVDLTFSIIEIRNEVQLGLEFSTKLFKRSTVQEMLESLVNIFRIVIHDNNIQIHDIQIINQSVNELVYETEGLKEITENIEFDF